MQSDDQIQSEAVAKTALFIGGVLVGFLFVVMLGLLVIAAYDTGNDGVASAQTDPAAIDEGADDGGAALTTHMETPTATESEVNLIATEFSYEPEPIVLAKTTTLSLQNDGAVLHNFVIEGIDNFVLEVDAGAVATADIALNPGQYVVFCSVPGHRAAGMETTITVE